MGLSIKEGCQEEGNMLTKKKVKETMLITILNVALPTVDILTDLMSITKFYIGNETHYDCDEENELNNFVENYNKSERVNPSILWTEVKRKCIDASSANGFYHNRHPIWATSLLVPFLINYLVTWFIWWSVDKRKTVGWIAPLLSVYPQVRPKPLLLHLNFARLGASSEGDLPHLD